MRTEEAARGEHDRAREISSAEIVAPLPEAVRRTIAGHVEIRTYPRNAVVVPVGSTDRRMIGVIEGGVRLSRFTLDGHELVSHLLGPREVYGLTFADRSIPAPSQLTARSLGAVVWSGEFDDVMRFVMEEPAGARKMLEVAIARLRESQFQTETAGIRSTTARVRRHLYHLGSKNNRWETDVTHEELAGLALTSRETVSRVLGSLRAEGVIAYGRVQRGIRIMHPERLLDQV